MAQLLLNSVCVDFLFLSEEFPLVQKIVLLPKLTALMADIRDSEQKQQKGGKKLH